MFCNQCGKNNEDGVRYCVQCGNPLLITGQFDDRDTSGIRRNAAYTKAADHRVKEDKISWKKVIIIVVAIMILAIIAVYNIVKVYSSVANVKVKNKWKSVNNIYDMLEVNDSIYYTDYDSLYRINTETGSVDKISSNTIYIIAPADNGIYCADENSLYRSTNNTQRLEKIGYSFNYSAAKGFFVGRYNYAIMNNCKIIKRLNSNNFSECSKVIYKGSPDYQFIDAKMYKNHLYLSVVDYTDDSGINKLIRISLDNGKEEILLENEGYFAEIMNNKIYYLKEDGIYVMDMNGKNRKLQISAEVSSYSSTMFTKEYVYVNTGDGIYRYDLDGSNKTYINLDDFYSLCPLSFGLGVIKDDRVVLYDFDGEQIAQYYQ